MLEVTLTQVQTYLWLTIWVDSKLTAILDWVNEKVESNVWDISLWVKTMTIKNNTVKNSTFTLDIIEPTDLTEINWTDISSLVSWIDYLIKSDWDVIIKDLYTYIANDFGYFEVKFNAWYSEVPKSLIAIVSEYVGYLYSQDTWKDVTEEQLWPRWVTYEENNIDWQNLALKKFKNWLRQFIPLALKIY